jgi:hypothetical protein
MNVEIQGGTKVVVVLTITSLTNFYIDLCLVFLISDALCVLERT